MAHYLNPIVPITLDKPRNLLYGAAAFIEFKEATGQDLLRFMREMSEQFAQSSLNGAPNPNFEMPYKSVRDILWAGLLHEDETLTRFQVSNMFTLGTLSDVVPLIMEAFVLGLGKPDDNERPRKAPVKTTRRK